ncbi:MAG: DUF11 domain-containing protein [Opitutales bacterium]|nr:DUF11 domain-containing protein [Opitutales bacterium]
MKTKRRSFSSLLVGIAAAITLTGMVQANPTSQNYPFHGAETQRTAVARAEAPAPAPRAAPAPAARPAPAPAAAAAPVAQAAQPSDSESVVYDGPLFRVIKEVISTGQVGSDFTYRIRVEAKENLANIRVHEELPDNVRFTRSSPSPSEEDGQNLLWAYDRQSAGSSRTFDVTVVPTTEGRFEPCTIVTADPILCLPMYAGSANLAISKTGPDNAEVGETITFDVTVTNTGTAPARNVRIEDELPRGLSARGAVTDSVRSLDPGESHTFPVEARANETGEFLNRASAVADGVDRVSDDHLVRVAQPGIEIEKTGPEREFVFSPARYDIVVRNTGDVTLDDVVVTDTLPEGAELVDAGGADHSGRTLTWRINSLSAGSERSYSIAYTSNVPTTLTNRVAVETARGLSDSDSATTRFVAAPGVKSVMYDDNDPIRVGDTVTYIVEITNQGQFESVSVEGYLTLSSELEYIDASGPSRFTFEDGQIRFAEVDIRPRRTIKIEVRARAVNAGVGRATLNYMPAYLSEHIIEQESTFIY